MMFSPPPLLLNGHLPIGVLRAVPADGRDYGHDPKGGIVEVIGIRARSHADGEFVLEALKTAVDSKRVALDDIALVARDEHGEVEIRPQARQVPPQGDRPRPFAQGWQLDW